MNAESECVIWDQGLGLDCGHEDLGIHILGGRDFPLFKIVDVTDPGVFIAGLNDGSLAQKDGRLKVGDKILAVNGVSVESVTRDEFVRVFADASKERLVLEVIHGAAAKIMSEHERGKNSMDGDNALLTFVKSAFPSQDGELKGQNPENLDVSQRQDQAFPVGFPPISTSVPPSASLTSLPSPPLGAVPPPVSPSVSLTSGVDEDLDSVTSLVSTEEMPPRPESSLDVLESHFESDPRHLLDLSGRCGRSFFALERVEEVEDEDLRVSASTQSDLTLAEDDVEDDDGDDDGDDDIEAEMMLDEACQVGNSSSSGSLDSDSDEELRRCRESVCPESHEVTPRTSPVGFSVEGRSPTKTDNSSRDSSATPETVVARSTWLANRAATPARALLRHRDIDGTESGVGSESPGSLWDSIDHSATTPEPENPAILTIQPASSERETKLDNVARGPALIDNISTAVTDVVKEESSAISTASSGPSVGKRVDEYMDDVDIDEGNSGMHLVNGVSEGSDLPVEIERETAETRSPDVDGAIGREGTEPGNQQLSPQWSSAEEESPRNDSERQRQSPQQQSCTENEPPRYLTPESPAELEAIRQRLILQEAEMLSIDKEEKSRDWFSSAVALGCVGGVLALAAVLISKQIRASGA